MGRPPNCNLTITISLVGQNHMESGITHVFKLISSKVN